MRILLTGARGFTGRHFARVAEAAGYEVWPLQANLTDRAALQAEVARCAPMAVVHLAAISAVNHADATALYQVNVVGTDHLLSAVAALPALPQKVLLASSANVYGHAQASDPLTELAPAAPVSHYGISKLAMEQLRLQYPQLPIVVTRPFNYTGVGHDDRFVVPKLIDHFKRKVPGIELGNLDVEREFNDVRMVVAAYLRLLEHGEPGATYNVCTGNPVALRQVIATLTELTGHRIDVGVNPAFVRANEIARLCGDNFKLVKAIGALEHFDLRDTLAWMLGA